MSDTLTQDELKAIAVHTAQRAYDAVIEVYKLTSGAVYDRDAYYTAGERAFRAYDSTFWAVANAIGYNRV